MNCSSLAVNLPVTGLDLGEMQERDPHIDDPYATTAMLSGLQTLTKYRVHIWARTAKGRGEGYFIEITTTRAGGTAYTSRFVCWPVLSLIHI